MFLTYSTLTFKEGAEKPSQMKTDPITKIKVMTYNVHSCRGLDGKVNPERICQVIEKYYPDFLALQELDVDRKSSQNIDQPAFISEYLRMHCHFHPAVALEKEHFGIAVLSRHPFKIIKAGHLRGAIPEKSLKSRVPVLKYFSEPRGAIGVQAAIQNKKINLFTTHLGLTARARKLQVTDILSNNWLGSLSKEDPIIFCGDFNAGPNSIVYKMITKKFQAVKASFKKGQKRNTFLSRCPLFELDHIFYSGNIKLDSAHIPFTALTRLASDHLPVIADFTLDQGSS